MKTISTTIIALLLLVSFNAKATVSCEITKVNGGGFSTKVESVVNNCNSTYTISLLVTHNGSGGPSNKELSHFSVEALPGTYTNVSLAVITGSMTYSSYTAGPNLGVDPFQGFKFDGTSNIGGGVAGSFRVTYTIIGSLQTQRVSCKAGTSGQIVTFNVADFEYVRDCNNTNCNAVADTDGDGCNDDVDQYPNDNTQCMDNFFPATGFGTVAYEDLWPAKGDYDFNDLILDYRFKAITSANNFVKEVYATFTIKAFGAGYENGFGFQIGSAAIQNNDITVTGYSLKENYINLNSNGTEFGQTIPTIIVFDNAYKQMAYPGSGIGVNTTPGAPYVTPVTLTIKIALTPEKYTLNQISLATFNPFLIVKKIRGTEVHLPNYPPTALANPALFGTVDDNSNPGQNIYYKTENNLPWAINVYQVIDYVIEKQDISVGYLKFAPWAESNGVSFTDWFLDIPGNIDQSKIYQGQ